MAIDASATKDFFLSILTKDIDLVEAIVDLIDNSVDGARRLRPNGSNLRGLFAHLDLSADSFTLTDNCGGIDVEVARKYAFRFGRNANTPSTKHSVGQFGVGMKRAIFKLGNKISIESATKTTKFTIDFHVNDWKKKATWDLEFKTLQDKLNLTDAEIGTTIKITALHEGVANELQLATFRTRLKAMIESAHAESLRSGLEIRIGDYSVTGAHPALLETSGIASLFKETKYFEKTKNPVITKIYAGVSASSPADAGWYVICNGRTILAADQNSITGWGDGTPRFHNQYSRFRGYVFFDSDDASLLPWNTTKTSVDAELPLYRATRLEMIAAMKPVLEFLNKLDREKDTEEKPLTEAVERAKQKALELINKSPAFQYKIKPAAAVKKLTRIQYQRPVEEVEKVKKMLRVSTLTAVGEKTFEYYLTMEGDE